MALTDGIPRETVAFSSLTAKHNIGAALAITVRLVAVLCAIKHICQTAHSPSRNQITVLRAVASTVDFTLVVDTLSNLNASGCRRIGTDFWCEHMADTYHPSLRHNP